MQSSTLPTNVSLLDVLRQRETQARAYGDTYLAPVPDENSMLYWLARAAASTRAGIGRKQVHIAASLGKDQSTIARFEKGLAWPRDPDEVVDAYADDLEVDSIELWAEALRLWAEYRATTPADVAEVVEAEAARQTARRSRSGPSPHTSRRSKAI